MSPTPFVSVIIPTYNHAPMLHEALKALQAQTFTNWEAIVINNFSTDETIEVVNSFNDQRFTLINFSNKGIIAASRNEGIRNARANIIAFLDSDDFWYPTKLELSLAALTADVDLVCHGEIWQKDGHVAARMQYGPLGRADYKHLLFEGNCLSTSAIIVRKQCLLEAGCFSEALEMITAEDYELWLKLARNNVRFAFIDTMLGEYRIHEGNASKAVIRNMNAELHVVEKHFSSLREICQVTESQLNRRKSITRINAARRLISENAYADAFSCIAKAFADFPAIPFTIFSRILRKTGIAE